MVYLRLTFAIFIIYVSLALSEDTSEEKELDQRLTGKNESSCLVMMINTMALLQYGLPQFSSVCFRSEEVGLMAD